MKPENQRIAIAEACGWQFANSHSPETKETAIMCWVRPGNSFWQTEKLPDYFNDLNAMHDAEMSLNPDQQKRFIEYLIEGEAHDEYCTEMLWDSSWVAAHATAAQRAEAFLRTIGKWEE